MAENNVIIEMRDICKAFGGTKALTNMSMVIEKGKIHALIGENGAGKSTLMKVLSGAVSNDSGVIKVDGNEVKITSPKTSIDLGISVIYQEFVLAPHLTVAENIFIDRFAQGKILVDWKKLREDAKDILSKLGFDDIDPNAEVRTLTVAYQQVVEICKSLSRNAKVLILDEPSAVLTFTEVEKLFSLLRGLREQGVAIVFISHRLEEIFQLCDDVTVMKDGCFVGRYDIHELTQQMLVEKMVGRELASYYPERHAEIGEVMLEVKGLNAGRMVQNISFYVKRGEVVGFSGLVGAGRTETMRAVFGADKKDSGKIYLKGEEVSFKNPKQAVNAKVGLLPEDRKQQGVILDLPIQWNTTLTVIGRVSRAGVMDRKSDKEFAGSALEKLRTKYETLTHPVSSLSGGNQQKVSLSKWLAAGCEVVILDEPTRGVDVGAKAEIYKNINELAEAGVAVIMVSSELQEIINMCDRAYVMRQGRMIGELQKSELSEISLMKLAVEVK